MHIKLTETCYIESESIDIIELSERYGQPWVVVWTKRQDRCELDFRGDEATEAWGNWQAHIRDTEVRRSGVAELAVPKMEPLIESLRTTRNEPNQD